MNHPDDMILMQISCHRTNSEVIDMIFTHTHIHPCMHPSIPYIHTYIHSYIHTLHYNTITFTFTFTFTLHYHTLHYNITLLHCIKLCYIVLHCTAFFFTFYYIITLYIYIYMYICMIIYFGHGMTFGPVKSGLHHNFSFVLSLTFQTVTIFAVYETIYISSIDVDGTSTTWWFHDWHGHIFCQAISDMRLLTSS